MIVPPKETEPRREQVVECDNLYNPQSIPTVQHPSHGFFWLIILLRAESQNLQ